MTSALESLAFMHGYWRGSLSGEISEEIWLPPAGGAMLGTYRWVADEGVKFLELLAIAADDAHELVFRLRHFDPTSRRGRSATRRLRSRSRT